MSAVATARAVRLHAAGGTEGFRVEELPVPAPGPGEILIRQTVAGLNFLDIYHRRGLLGVANLLAIYAICLSLDRTVIASPIRIDASTRSGLSQTLAG